MTRDEIATMTREQHIERLEKSMQRWRDYGMDHDGIFDEEYQRYMRKLDSLKNGAEYKIVSISPALAIATAGAEICNVVRTSYGIPPKPYTSEQMQKVVAELT